MLKLITFVEIALFALTMPAMLNAAVSPRFAASAISVANAAGTHVATNQATTPPRPLDACLNPVVSARIADFDGMTARSMGVQRIILENSDHHDSGFDQEPHDSGRWWCRHHVGGSGNEPWGSPTPEPGSGLLLGVGLSALLLFGYIRKVSRTRQSGASRNASHS